MTLLPGSPPLEDVFDFVRQCPTFAGTGVPVQRLLAERMELVAFDEGARILEQGSRARGVYVIVSGSADVVVRDAEREPRRLAQLAVGHVFGEMSLVTDSPISADVVATAPLRALALDAEAFTALAREHPEVGIALTYLTAERLGRERIDGLGGKTLNGYRILRCVGRGAMAVVYEAQRVTDGATVALKMMSHRLLFEAGGLERFHREADVLMSLRHEGIARHEERFDAYGTCFLAMEFCDGEDLGALLRRVCRLPEPVARGVVGQLAATLLHLHERGVLHRDLKPSNVMTTHAGAIKLTDFGLARPRTLREADEFERLVGTPIYMPELQLRGAPDDGAADRYALACVALELIHGEPPFRATSLVELARQKRDWRPPRDGISWRLWRHLCRLTSGRERGGLASLRRLARQAAPLPAEFRPPIEA